MTKSVSIRPLEAADVAAADRVLRAAFNRPQSFLPALAIGRAIEPEGLLAAFDCGTLVGTVGAVNYGALAYVGLMAVEPARQGSGIGRMLVERLLEWLDQRGCPVVLLDATDQGARLYETLDFVDDAMAYVYTRDDAVAATQRPAAAMPSGCTVRLARPDEQAEIAAFDARRFGADRHRLLAALFALERAPCLVARQSSGELAGFLFVRDGVLGPWVAADPTAADALLTAALSSPFERHASEQLRVMVPRSNQDAQTLLARRGFSERRRLRHMRRGGAGPPGVPGALFGQASFAHG